MKDNMLIISELWKCWLVFLFSFVGCYTKLPPGSVFILRDESEIDLLITLSARKYIPKNYHFSFNPPVTVITCKEGQSASALLMIEF